MAFGSDRSRKAFFARHRAYQTGPHAEHLVSTVPEEAHLSFPQRIYDVKDRQGNRLGFTGAELASLAQIALQEAQLTEATT